VFHIKYPTCNKEYVSQTGESLKLGFCKQLKYTTTHNLHSVYAPHVLNHQHQHGPIQDTMEIRTPARKSTRMNSMGLCYTKTYQQEGLLTTEHNFGILNPLDCIACDMQPQCTRLRSTVD